MIYITKLVLIITHGLGLYNSYNFSPLICCTDEFIFQVNQWLENVMKITDEHFESFLHCPYKAYLLINNESGEQTDFEILQTELQNEYKSQNLPILRNKYAEGKTSSKFSIALSDLKRGEKIIFCENIDNQELACGIGALERVDDKSSAGKFYYCPVLFSYKEKLTKEDKILASFKSYVLSRLQSKQSDYAKIIYGQKQNLTRIKTSTNIKKVNFNAVA